MRPQNAFLKCLCKTSDHQLAAPGAGPLRGDQPGAVRIKDVAKHARVSVTTVSNVLNDWGAHPRPHGSACWKPSKQSDMSATPPFGSCGPAAAAPSG